MDAQADLRLCCLHIAKTGFLMTWLNLYIDILQKLKLDLRENKSQTSKAMLNYLQLRRIPILRKIMVTEKEAGKDVTLKEGKEFDFEAAEKEDEERAKREEEEGEDGSRDRRRR